MGTGPVRSWCGPSSAGSVSTRSPASAASRWSINATRPLPARPVHVREARTSRAAVSSANWKTAGRIVEYGTPVEAANRSMLSWARWLIPSESAEALSTEMRVTCSIDGMSEAALIAMRCSTPWMPIDPIAMNTVRTPPSAFATS